MIQDSGMTYDTGNIFAKILRGDIPAEKIYEDSDVIAIRDIQPAAPVHVLVIPRGEYTSFDDFVRKADSAEVANFYATIQKIATQLGLQESGYRLIMNHGTHAHQTVPHYHVHILGGKTLGPLLADDGGLR